MTGSRIRAARGGRILIAAGVLFEGGSGQRRRAGHEGLRFETRPVQGTNQLGKVLAKVRLQGGVRRVHRDENVSGALRDANVDGT